MILSTIKAMREAKAKELITLSDLCRVRDIGGVARIELRQAGIKPTDGVHAWEREGTRFKKSALFCWATELD